MSRLTPEMTIGTKKVFGSNCWICEGWSQVEFIIDPKNLNENPLITENSEIYLHLQKDDFEPCKLTYDKKSQSYHTIWMVPARDINFYISINGKGFY